MDQARLERMLKLMMALSDNEQTTVHDLAREYGITTRSIYRYLDTFVQAGFCVNKLSPGVYSLTSIGDKVVDFSRLVMFSQEEAYIVSSLISTLDNSNTLKEGLSRKLSAVYKSTAIAEFVTNKATTKQVETLNEAMLRKCCVVLHGYESGHSHIVSDRYVEPFKFSVNLTDVIAFEPSSGKVKVFKISRARSVELLQEPWAYEYAHNVPAQDVFRMCGDTETTVKVELRLMAKNLLLEEYPMAARDLRRTSTGKWVLKTKVRDMSGVGRFVVGLADQVRILESPELVDYVAGFRSQLDHLVFFARR